jgi:hypothetical protein
LEEAGVTPSNIKSHKYLLVYLFTVLSFPFLKRFGPRFFSLDRAYDNKWKKIAKSIATEMGFGKLNKKLHMYICTA